MPSSELDEAVLALLAAGRASWPAVRIDEKTLIDRVSEIVRASDDALRDVRAMHPDLCLAVAGLRHDPAAITEIDRIIRDCASRVSLPEAPADELALNTREQLFVPDADGRPAKLARYSGTGPLKRWLQVLVTRVGLTMQRRARRGGMRRVAEDALELLPGGMTSPETEALRQRFAEPFRLALRDALATLSAEDRNLLRFHFVDGLGLDRLAPLLGVHRATAARRLARAKETVLDATRDLMRERVGLGDSEFASVVGLLLSRAEAAASFLGTAGT
jgi:RNA polymerase sigma-70 factor, ECF subfamily